MYGTVDSCDMIYQVTPTTPPIRAYERIYEARSNHIFVYVCDTFVCVEDSTRVDVYCVGMCWRPIR